MKLQSFLLVVIFIIATHLTINAQDFWQPTNGPYGGSVRCIAENSKGILFALSDQFMYKSTDNGDNWSRLNYEFQNWPTSFAINHKDNIFVFENQKIYKSFDEGNTWEEKTIKITGFYIYTIAFDKNNNIYAGGYEKMYKSTDNGNSFFIINKNMEGQTIHCSVFGDNNVLYVGTRSGVFKSTDYGNDWIAFNITLNNDIASLMLGPDNTILAGTYGNGIFKSSTINENWVQINSGLSDRSDGKIYVYSFAKINNNIYAGTFEKGVFLSDDNGYSWKQLNDGIKGVLRIEAFIATKNNKLLIGSDIGLCGLFKSDNGGLKWQPLAKGMDGWRISDIVADNYGNIYAGTDGGCVYKSTDKGNSWIQKAMGFGVGKDFNTNNQDFKINCIEIKNNLIYCGTQAGTIYCSSDRGDNWTEFHYTGDGYTVIRDLCFNEVGDLFVLTDNNLIRTKDNGKSWDTLNTNMAWAINNMVISKNGNILYSSYYGVDKSTDGGKNWISIKDLEYKVGTLKINGKGDLFYLADMSLYKSTDEGNHWEIISYNDFTDILFAKNDYCIASSYDKGMFLSANNCSDWLERNEGLNNMYVSPLEIDNEDNIYIGCRPGIIYRTINKLDNPPTIGLLVTPVAKQILSKGSSINYTIDIRDTENKPIPNSQLTISDRLRKIENTMVSDSDGKSYYATKVPENALPGDYNIEFYASKGGYKNSVTISSQIEVKDLNELIILEKQLVDWEQKIDYSITVKDKDSNPIDKAKINIIDGIQDITTDKETDSKGILIYSTTIPSGKPDGDYSISFSASKTDYDNSQIITRNFEINHITFVYDAKEDSNLMIYPIPTSRILHVKSSKDIIYPLSIRIVNPLGITIYYNDNFILGLNNQFDIDLSNNPSGDYLMSIQIGRNSYQKKIVLIQ